MRIMIFLATLLMGLVSTCGWAYVADYFKAVGEKESLSSLPGIDFIYMINLDERPEKYSLCSGKLAAYGIHPHRFSAVNGWRLSMEAINELGVTFAPWMEGGVWGTYYPIEEEGHPTHEVVHTIGRTYYSHCMARGTMGIVLSHLSILQDAYDSGYETIWVLEDDVEVVRDPHVLPDLIAELDAVVGAKNWDILFTDQDTIGNDNKRVPCAAYAWRPNFSPANPHRFVEKVNITPTLRRIGSRYGAYSMILRRSGMKKILNFFKQYQIFLPYDMEYTQPDDIRLFTVLDDVVIPQINALSDNGAPYYENNTNRKK